MDCVAAAIAPQLVSSLVKLLSARLQQPDLNHLKRVHRVDGVLLVLMWTSESEPDEELVDLKLANFDMQAPPPARLLPSM